MNKELRIGVIGVGGRGKLAELAHRPAEGVRLVAGADIDNAALDAFHSRFGPDVFITHDYRRLLERREIDAVFVTSPDYLHEEQALAALNAGKAVYLEKPMAITLAGCDRLLRAASEQKARLYLGHNMRHMSFTRKMKELIDAGAIGEVKTAWCRHFIAYGGDAYFKDWHAERSKSTGLLLQKAAHDFDILNWFCGGYPLRVHALGGLTLYDRIADRHAPNARGDAKWSMANWPPLSQKGLHPVIDVEDISLVQMELDNGVLVAYQQCHFTPDAWRNYTVIGSAGRIENFGDRPGACEVRVWNRRTSYKAEGDERHVIPEETGGHGGADPRIVAEFIRFAREGGPISTSPLAARYSVAAGFMATHSLRHGGVPMDIPKVEPEIERYFRAGTIKST